MNFFTLFSKKKTNLITSLSYQLTGDSLGSEYHLTVSALNDDNASIEITKKEYANSPLMMQNYICPADIFAALTEVINRYEMTSWNKEKVSDLIALDEGITEVFFTSEGRTVRCCESQMPKNGSDAFDEILSTIDSYAKNENSSLSLEETLAADSAVMDLPLSIKMRITSYENGYAEISIRNESGYAADLSQHLRLEHFSDDTYKEITPKSLSDNLEHLRLEDLDSMTILVDLNVFGTLQPGKYRLFIDEFSCDFTLIK